jgi:hypothetical protein
MKKIILTLGTLFIFTAGISVLMGIIFAIAPIPVDGLYAQIFKVDIILSFIFAVALISCGALNEYFENTNRD